jgi:excisionase family DNA binding protein
MSAISMTEPIEKIYTLKEVADILRISVRTVYRMIKSGELDAFRVRDEYRVLKSTLEAFIARRGERE